jgi:ABC-type lipoprotein export system ATPase subunit
MKKIKSIEIKNSKFFKDIFIEFSNQLNCIMGGRGTGKTTLMYFVSSCLYSDAENNKDIFNILKENLSDGEITLWMEGDDSTEYKIVKTFGDQPQPYLFPTSDYVALNKISSSIECDFYKAGKIEEIGRSKAERLQLLDKRIKHDVAKLKNELKEVQFDLTSNAQDIKNSNSRLQAMIEMQSQFFDVEEEFNNHKINQPKNISDADSQKFEQADKDEKTRISEKRFFSKTIDFLEKLSTKLEDQASQVESFKLSNRNEISSYLNKEIFDIVLKDYDSNFEQIEKSLEKINVTISDLKEKLVSSLNQLNNQHDLQQAEFIKLKQTFEVNREYVNKYHQLSKRVDEKKNLTKEIEEFKLKNNRLHNERKLLIDKLNKIKGAIYTLRYENIVELNDMFKGVIMITLEFCGNNDEYEQLLRDSLKGSGLRYNELIPKIVKKLTPDQFAKAIHEKNIDKLREIEGIDQARAMTLINTLYNTDYIFNIEKLYCDDLPNFKLRLNEGDVAEENYRVSEELSLGQRCTTVLPIIFAISDNPLFIDQPEDNLDNRFITEQIHEIIRTQKQKRQIIFITHNPNIPVLSDSETNIFLAYDKKSDIHAHGNISDVKDSIVNLLEGGKKAFLTRKEKYGY